MGELRVADPVFAKCAWRLIPFITLLYVVGFIDRSNVGFAALTMNRDLGFSPAIFGLGAGIFFLGYVTFQIPTAVLLARVGARRVIFCVMLVWGLVSASNAFMRDAHSFYLLRFLLGVAEGGFTPSMIFYLTLWFPEAYRGRFIAIFCSAIPIAGMISGPLSSLILGMEGIGHLHGWQWLFLIQGLPAVLLAFVVLAILPDTPGHARWLSDTEKSTIAASLAAGPPPPARSVSQTLYDPRLILLGFAGLGSGIALYGINLWLPQIIQAMGFSNCATGFVAALPYAVSMVAMIAWGRLSDARNKRILDTALTMLLAAAALGIASFAGNPFIVLVALALGMAGGLAGIGPFQSLLSSYARGPAAASGLALVNTIGTFGGFFGPVIVGTLKGWTGNYGAAMAALAGAQLLAALIILGAGRAMERRRQKPDLLSDTAEQAPIALRESPRAPSA
ncbi:MAG TPA: MFS transporter [Rhizomicrobium sp.]|nr:MFS transporter [Rhizomicrobium sp.]